MKTKHKVGEMVTVADTCEWECVRGKTLEIIAVDEVDGTDEDLPYTVKYPNGYTGKFYLSDRHLVDTALNQAL